MAEEKSPLVAVIVLTMNQREKTERFLESFRGVRSPPFRLVLWDNGSQDGTAEVVRERFPEVHVHPHPENLGVASGRNAAVELAVNEFDPPYLLFIDNDMVVAPDFLDALVAPFANDPRLAQTTGKIRCIGDEARLYGAGGCVLRFWLARTGHVGYGEIDRGQYDRPHPCLPSGGCMLVRTDVFQRLGGFDAAYDPYGPEDLDFDLRVREAGFRALYVPGAVVYHEPKPGHTFGGGMKSERYVRSKTRLWFVFMRRHASLGERLAFYLAGAPYTLLRMLVREARRGNLAALPGLARGAVATRELNPDLKSASSLSE